MNWNQQGGGEAVGGEAGPAGFGPFAITTGVAMHGLRLYEVSPAAKNLRGPLARLGKPIGTEQSEDAGIGSVRGFGVVRRGIAVRWNEKQLQESVATWAAGSRMFPDGQNDSCANHKDKGPKGGQR